MKLLCFTYMSVIGVGVAAGVSLILMPAHFMLGATILTVMACGLVFIPIYYIFSEFDKCFDSWIKE